jgi:hypothetical protein
MPTYVALSVGKIISLQTHEQSAHRNVRSMKVFNTFLVPICLHKKRRRYWFLAYDANLKTLDYRGDNLRRIECHSKRGGGTDWPIKIVSAPSPSPFRLSQIPLTWHSGTEVVTSGLTTGLRTVQAFRHAGQLVLRRVQPSQHQVYYSRLCTIRVKGRVQPSHHQEY